MITAFIFVRLIYTVDISNQDYDINISQATDFTKLSHLNKCHFKFR